MQITVELMALQSDYDTEQDNLGWLAITFDDAASRNDADLGQAAQIFAISKHGHIPNVYFNVESVTPTTPDDLDGASQIVPGVWLQGKIERQNYG